MKRRGFFGAIGAAMLAPILAKIAIAEPATVAVECSIAADKFCRVGTPAPDQWYTARQHDNGQWTLEPLEYRP